MGRSKEERSSNMSDPINLNYAQKLRRDGAGFYLSELARGFLKGEIISPDWWKEVHDPCR